MPVLDLDPTRYVFSIVNQISRSSAYQRGIRFTMGAKLLKMLKTDMPPLIYRYLGPVESLYVDLYNDALYRNVDDGVKSSDGMVIVLRGYNGNASLLGWRSKGTMIESLDTVGDSLLTLTSFSEEWFPKITSLAFGGASFVIWLLNSSKIEV